MKRSEVAEDIWLHIEQKKIKRWITKNQLRKGVMCQKTGEKYTSTCVLGAGVKELVQLGLLKKVTNVAYKVIKDA